MSPTLVRLLPAALAAISCGTAPVARGTPVAGWRAETGDLLFLDLACETCRAIADVTVTQYGVRGPRLSHVGIVERGANGRVWVLEAWPREGAQRGVMRTPLLKVLARAREGLGQKGGFYVWKPCGPWRRVARRAVQEAKKLLRSPYDERFVLADSRFYCSELVHVAFSRANGGRAVFRARPMFFGRAGSSAHAIWRRYYASRHWPIPDREPGLSPLGLYLDAKGLCAR